MNKVNSYCAYSEEYHGVRTAMYSGYASTKERFAQLCEENGYNLEGLEIELVHSNVRNELGRPYPEKAEKDLGVV